ncbi:MAG TPA: hypothetical protein VF710_25730 [Longimicrobium sp.]|jgi:hypothetical protein
MPERESTSVDHLEHARELVWEALQAMEEAQRVMFKAGDCYVGQVWGDGVRTVIEMTERMADIAGDLSTSHIEIGRLVKTDTARDPQPPP